MRNIILSIVKKFDRIRVVCRYKNNKIILELFKAYSYQKKVNTLIRFTGIIAIKLSNYLNAAVFD